MPHIVSYDKGSRALFVRTAEPVSAPNEVAIVLGLGRLFPDRFGEAGYVFRFSVRNDVK